MHKILPSPTIPPTIASHIFGIQVRVLESERAFERLELTQTSMYDALAFSTFFNAALIMTSTFPFGSTVLLPMRISWALTAVFGLRIPLGLFKVRTCDEDSNGIKIDRTHFIFGSCFFPSYGRFLYKYLFCFFCVPVRTVDMYACTRFLWQYDEH